MTGADGPLCPECSEVVRVRQYEMPDRAVEVECPACGWGRWF